MFLCFLRLDLKVHQIALLYTTNGNNLRKLHFLSKIYKILFEVPGHLIISYCSTSTEKTFEFMDHHLKLVMKKVGHISRNPGNLSELKLMQNTRIQYNIIIVVLYYFITQYYHLIFLQKSQN